MLRAIGVYEINTASATHQLIKTGHVAPKPQIFSFFSDNPLESIENNTFRQLTKADLEVADILHFQYKTEHHYVKRVTGTPFLIVICSKNPLDAKEAAYLMINIQHAFERPDSSRVTLEDIIINPLAYITKDHLIVSARQDIEEVKQISLNNINALLERGERIDDLYASTVKLTQASATFKHRAQEQNSWCSGSYCSI